MMKHPSAAPVAAAAVPDRKRILTEFLHRVWSQGDTDTIDLFIAPTYTIHNDPGDPWEGQTLDRAGFRDRLIRSRAAAPDQVFTPVRMLEDGNRIAVAWTWTGTHKGDLPGVPATGKRISMTGLTVYDFDGDHLCGHWQVADRLGVYRQLTEPDQSQGP